MKKVMYFILAMILTVVYLHLLKSLCETAEQLTNELTHATSLLESQQQELAITQALLDSIEETVAVGNAVAFKPVCASTTFKSFMDYRAITSPSSRQYKQLQKGFTVSEYGILVQDGRFLVAMAKQYGEVGTDLAIQIGDTILAVRIGDIKGVACAHKDGSMLEFIVDTKRVPKKVQISGNFNDIFKGKIDYIWED